MEEIVLMYHDIGLDSGFQNSTAYKYKISPKVFGLHLDIISKCKKNDNKVYFTFDDGGESFIKYAAPILEEYGYKGIFFISTKYINTPGFLTESQIKQLAERGHILGVHSHTHPEDMTKLTDVEILNEWLISQNILLNILGYKSEYASIPNGFSSSTIIKAMIKSGIKYIYTSEPTTKIEKYENSFIIGRYAITDYDNEDTVLKIVNHKSVRIKMFLRYQVLNIAKFILGTTYLKIRNKLLKTQ